MNWSSILVVQQILRLNFLGSLINDVRTYYYNNPIEHELIKHNMEALRRTCESAQL